jgi:hypothetical protein
MPVDQLVLFKSRRQRLVELLIMPVIALPIGPALRAFLGTRYDVYYALAATMLAFIAMGRLGNQWAARHGGEWVTKAERLRRLVAECEELSRWPMALAAGASGAMSLLGFLLIIEPLDHLGDALGGPLLTFGAVAVVAVAGSIRTLLGFRAPAPPTVVDEPQPPSHFWAQLRDTLPLTYAAYLVGAVAALAVALQVQPTMQTGAFILTFLIVSQLQLLLRPKAQRVYPVAVDASLGRQVIVGILLWGIPMGIMFSAGMALDVIGRPFEIAIRIAMILPLCVVGGAAFGLLIYVSRRLSETRRAQ